MSSDSTNGEIADGSVDSVFSFSTGNVLDQSILRDLINTAYTYYISYSDIPTIPDLERRTPFSRQVIEDHTDNPAFWEAMNSRGVPWKKASRLDSRMNLLISVITNPADKRDLEKKLKACKVSYPQYRAWLKNPLFKATIDDFAAAALKDNMAAVDTGLLSLALKGNLPAIQYYHQITGRFDPNQQSRMEVSAVLNRVVEIIAQNVKDPEALGRIGDSIQNLALEAGLVKPSPVAVTEERMIEGQVIR